MLKVARRLMEITKCGKADGLRKLMNELENLEAEISSSFHQDRDNQMRTVKCDLGCSHRFAASQFRCSILLY